MAGVIATPKSQDHTTPAHVIDMCAALWGGPPDLDPCDNPSSVVGARRRIWPERFAGHEPRPPGVEIGDGLVLPWEGSVFVNPPYGRELEDWLSKCYVSRRGQECEIVALIPAYTGLVAWHRWVMPGADAVCFLRGRLRFGGNKWTAAFASALAYYGPRPHRFAKAFDSIGHTVWP